MSMMSFSLRHRLHIMPVGWGFSSLHNIDYGNLIASIITDGGTYPTCYKHVVRKQSYLISELKDALDYSDLVVWIISHFDYDHISLVAQLLKITNKYADICIIPFTYSEQACREALALYEALITY
jgi:glyoxylase-like metal-dependent hydrolase (beta-lactamase superfamily II)